MALGAGIALGADPPEPWYQAVTDSPEQAVKIQSYLQAKKRARKQ